MFEMYFQTLVWEGYYPVSVIHLSVVMINRHYCINGHLFYIVSRIKKKKDGISSIILSPLYRLIFAQNTAYKIKILHKNFLKFLHTVKFDFIEVLGTNGFTSLYP